MHHKNPKPENSSNKNKIKRKTPDVLNPVDYDDSDDEILGPIIVSDNETNDDDILQYLASEYASKPSVRKSPNSTADQSILNLETVPLVDLTTKLNFFAPAETASAKPSTFNYKDFAKQSLAKLNKNYFVQRWILESIMSSSITFQQDNSSIAIKINTDCFTLDECDDIKTWIKKHFEPLSQQSLIYFSETQNSITIKQKFLSLQPSEIFADFIVANLCYEDVNIPKIETRPTQTSNLK